MPIYGDYKYYLDPDGLNHVIKNIKPCYIRVKCADELAGKTVRLHFNNEVVTTRKVPGEAPFVVEFGVKELGTYTVTEADYDLSAEVVVDNYTMYETKLYLGSITVTVEEEFIGQTISCSNGVTTKTWIADESKTHVFSVGLGTWTISGTVEGETYSEEVTVTEYINYDVELLVGVYREWLKLGRITKSFDSLDKILADQTTLRQLMTIHASADYMLAQIQRDVNLRSALLASDNALKWIGLRDYTYDKIPSDFLAEWLAGPYWERALKDHVPTMTSDTAPYGESFANSTLNPSFSPYKAFTPATGENQWHSNKVTSNVYIGYKFTNPICIRYIHLKTSSVGGPSSSKLQGSNDGSTWTDITNFVNCKDPVTDYNLLFDNNKYYTQYRLYINSCNYTSAVIYNLQFYGRSLDVSVPTMTSNTAPYGEVIPSSESRPGFNAFDGNTNDFWADATTDTNVSLEYNFKKPIIVKFVNLKFDRMTSGKIQASNDGSVWEDLSNVSSGNTALVLNNNKEYKRYRLKVVNSSAQSGYSAILLYTLNFYGVDYSEREFEQGSTIKYLYDHGVELEPLEFTKTGSSVVEKGNDYIIVSNSSTGWDIASLYTNNKIDFTNKSVFRLMVTGGSSESESVYGNIAVYDLQFKQQSQYMNYKAFSSVSYGENPNNVSLDIGNLNGLLFPHILNVASGSSHKRKIEVSEWWLE